MSGVEGFACRIQRGADRMGIALFPQQISALSCYFRELKRWNRRINLVSRKEADWATRHFLDSLAPVALGLIRGDESVLDLGAGGGFPGLPLKVVLPKLDLSLAESSGKKCAFLRHVIRTIELSGVRVLEGRFERLLETGWEGCFDLVVSRAASRPQEVLEAAALFLKGGGKVLVFTSDLLEDVERKHFYTLPWENRRRAIWEVRK